MDAAHRGGGYVRLGFHVPVSKGLVWAARHARRIRCECLQIFVRNARGWRGRTYPDEEVAGFRAALARDDLRPLVVHSCYLVNLASPRRELLAHSRRAVADDLLRAAALGARFVTAHTGYDMGAGREAGLRTLAESVRLLLSKAPAGVDLLLENAAGGEGHLGGRWEDFARLLDLLDGEPRLGFCFDTCHAHAAGYRLDGPRRAGEALREFDRVLGLDRLRLIHLNDSKGSPGGRLDRHEHLGKGTIGEAGLRAFLRRRELRDRCAILETPIVRPTDDARNLRYARELLSPRASAPRR